MSKKLNPEQASAHLASLGCPFTTSTLATWRCRKEGPRYIRLRNRIFYTKNSLEQFIKNATEIKTIDTIERVT